MVVSTPNASGGQKRSTTRRAILAVVAVMAVVAGGLVAFAVFSKDSASALEVSREALGTAGPNPYTAPVAPKPSASLADFAEKGAPAGAAVPELAAAGKFGYRTAQGNVAAIYGGTLDEAACDSAQLVSFLEAEPEKAAAWASIIEVEPADIPTYIAGLTPANLTVDTRVINFSFAKGASVPRHAVLQRGNAVMVDGRGVPRVNCYSGNPMKEPTQLDREEAFTGSAWPAFDAGAVVVIRPAPQPIEEFELVDVETGEMFTRPAGNSVAPKSEKPPGNTTVSKPAPKDDTTTVEVARAGAIKANQVYNGEVSAANPESRYTIDVPDGAVITLRIANNRASKAGVYATFTVAGARIDVFRVSPNAKDERQYLRSSADGGEHELVFTEGPAAFEFEVGIETQNDGGKNKDAGDAAASALEVTAGPAITGRIGDNDRMDRYTVKLQPGTELRLTNKTERTSTAAAYFQLQISGSNLYNKRVGPGANEKFAVLLGPQDDDILDILVSEGPSDYSFTVEFVAQRDGGQPGDAGNALAEPRVLTSLSDLSGTIGDRDDADFYVFTAPAAELKLNVSTAAASGAAPYFVVQGADGANVITGRVAPGATKSFPFKATAGQQYRIIVREGPASYVFSVGGP